ncbi:MAG: stage II sporulation protein R, partial [Clostridiales bacterium]|nr:stage II sporulation protein R [Clostridiales bacterium]
MNNFYKPIVMLKSILALFVLACFVMPIGVTFAKTKVELQNENIFRLHIIANSNSFKDQRVKYLVRDAVLSLESEIFENAEVVDSKVAKQLLMDNAKLLLQTIEKTLQENGFDYNAQMLVGVFDFPDRVYADVTYEAGKYEALRIVLGNGNGENWWCVMYPPLCINEPFSGQNGVEEKCEPKSIIVEFYTKISSWLGSIFS